MTGPDKCFTDTKELADKLAAFPLDQLHYGWPTVVPIRLSETERELVVNVLRAHAQAEPGPMVPWELKCQRQVCAAPECDCPPAQGQCERGEIVVTGEMMDAFDNALPHREDARHPNDRDKPLYNALADGDVFAEAFKEAYALLAHPSHGGDSEANFYIVNQHIGWLKTHLSGMNESNWRDMQVYAERQVEALSHEIDKQAEATRAAHPSHGGELDDLRKANELLHGLLSNRNAEIERLRDPAYTSEDDPTPADYRGEIGRLRQCISMAMGCLDPLAQDRPDEILAWYRLLDAMEGREPRSSLSSTDRQTCPRCKQHPIDSALLGTAKEGWICGQCWAEDRHAEALSSTTFKTGAE